MYITVEYPFLFSSVVINHKMLHFQIENSVTSFALSTRCIYWGLPAAAFDRNCFSLIKKSGVVLYRLTLTSNTCYTKSNPLFHNLNCLLVCWLIGLQSSVSKRCCHNLLIQLYCIIVYLSFIFIWGVRSLGRPSFQLEADHFWRI